MRKALCSPLSPTFAQNAHHFLENYYLKSKRAVEKPSLEGPSAYVIPADADDANRLVELLKVMKRQHVEVQQLSGCCHVHGPK